MADNKIDNGFNPTSKEENAKRNHRIKIIIIGTLGGLSIILFSLVLYFVFKKSTEVCLTRDCTLTAASLISAMDQTIDPCEDFYKFTCADFIRKNPVPENKLSMSTRAQYYDNLQLQLKDLIENYAAQNDPGIIKQMQETYHLCLNTSYNSENEFTALKSYIKDVYDGWPLLQGSKWKSKFERLDDYMAHISSFDTSSLPLVSVYLEVIDDNTTKDTKRQPKISFYREYAIEEIDMSIKEKEVDEGEEETRQKEIMIKFLRNVLKLFGNPGEIEVLREIQKMEEFAKYIREVYAEAYNVTDKTAELTIKELTEATNQTIDWLKIINTKFHGKHVYTNFSKVFVQDLEAVKRIPDITKKFSRQIIVNSVIWNILFYRVKDIGIPEMLRLLYKYNDEIYGENIKTIRWEFCLGQIEYFFPMAITRLFVNKFVDRNGKKIANEMIQLIQEAYKGRIRNSKWLDNSTKERALKKADAIQRFVGYPDFIFNDRELEKEYNYILPPNSTWFWTKLLLEKSISDKSDELSIEEKKKKWDFNPLFINAFYNRNTNSIKFPTGVLQLPFFDENRLAAVNFGMIGMVIGHEIGHAFDNGGSTYNEKGQKEMWWSNKTRTMFEKKTKCFINQYSKYCPEELQGGKDEEEICVNGKLTLRENLADNTGLKAAFDAYKLWIKKYGKEQKLPGLEKYSPEQVFFISFGYLWCDNMPPDKWIHFYKYVPHSPENYRVEGTLSNMPEFWEAFNCKKGPYNRGSDRCDVW